VRRQLQNRKKLPFIDTRRKKEAIKYLFERHEVWERKNSDVRYYEEHSKTASRICAQNAKKMNLEF
jgi:hypothetical protein